MFSRFKNRVPYAAKVALLYLAGYPSRKRFAKLKNTPDNGIVYLMIGEYSHIQHLLPLYNVTAGTVVVTSDKVRDELATKYNVDSILVDKYKIDDLLNFDDSRIRDTINYVNSHAKVVVTFDVIHLTTLTIDPKVLFIPHGASLGKADAFWGVSTRLKDVRKYDYIASMDAYTHTLLLREGVPKEKLVDLTIVRSTSLIRHTQFFKRHNKRTFRKKLKLRSRDKVVAYFPSYYTQHSVADVGLEICNNIDSKYKLIFWPHPHTDGAVINEYRKISKKKSNVIIGQDMSIDLFDVCLVADLFIVDPPTSVLTDAALTRKPIIFSYGAGEYNMSLPLPYAPLRNLVSTALRIDENNVGGVNSIIDRSRNIGIDKKAQKEFLSQFYNPGGNALEKTLDIIWLVLHDSDIVH